MTYVPIADKNKNLFVDMVKFLEKAYEKLYTEAFFIVFSASFSTSVTKLYPMWNRDV